MPRIRISRCVLWLLTSLALVLGPARGAAHEIGENYVYLNVRSNGLDGRFEFHIDDLKEKLGIEIDAKDWTNGVAQAQAAADTMHEYIRKNFSIGAGGEAFEIEFGDSGLFEEKTKWAQYHFRIPLPLVPDILEFEHQMMYENDGFHRGLLVAGYNEKTGVDHEEMAVVKIFGKSTTKQAWNVTQPVQPLLRPRDFIWQGVLHIWIGIDHILFLVVLLLPSVLKREEGQWKSLESFPKAMWNVVAIVTLFTIAHSITLALAALDVVTLPGALVESVIAASIVAVAANNIFPRFKEGSAAVIIGFGLFHGLGFASVMGELPFRMTDVWRVLLGFNIGVELGQLAIVLATFGVLYLLRQARFYQPVVLRGLSGAAALVALVWFIERAFDLSLIPALG